MGKNKKWVPRSNWWHFFKKIFFKPDEKYKNSSNQIGRPKGGIAWIVNNNIECKCNHFSSKISILKLKDMALIGVYMVYNDNTNETFNLYAIDLNIIHTIMFEFLEISILIPSGKKNCIH